MLLSIWAANPDEHPALRMEVFRRNISLFKGLGQARCYSPFPPPCHQEIN